MAFDVTLERAEPPFVQPLLRREKVLPRCNQHPRSPGPEVRQGPSQSNDHEVVVKVLEVWVRSLLIESAEFFTHEQGRGDIEGEQAGPHEDIHRAATLGIHPTEEF